MEIPEVISSDFFRKLGRDTFHEAFDLSRFARPTEAQVNLMPVATVELTADFGDYRCLHLLIRQDDGFVRLPPTLPHPEVIAGFIGMTEVFAAVVPKYPYLYLTIDTLFTKAGETQRTPGWHVDCVQGDEVPVKKPSNLTFSWCNAVPMEWADQTFVFPRHVNVSEYNIFECLEALVEPESIRQCEANTLYATNTYCVHRSAVAKVDTPRTFIRLSYTHVPITNNKATINPRIDYNYKVHSTEGKIPKHLKTDLL